MKIRLGKYKYLWALLYIFIALFVIYYKGDVQWKLGNTTTVNLSGGFVLENITGDFLIGPGKSNFEKYISFLSGTKNSLDFRMYNITYDDIIKTLKSIGVQGLRLRIILEDNIYKGSKSDFEKLASKMGGKNTEMKSDKGMHTTYVHAKTFVIDENTFIIQTANLTYSSFFRNREFFFVGKNGAIIKSLKTIFDKDWNSVPISKSDIHQNLLVCNIDCREKIENYLNSAQKSIWIQTPNIEDKNIISILQNKKNLEMKMILSDTEIEDKKNFGNIPLKFEKSPYLHAKTILIDDKILIVGSINLTQNSMDKNREISIALIDPDMIKKYKTSFMQDWEKGLTE